MRRTILASLLVTSLLLGCASAQTPVPTTAVDELDVDKYLGTWFEIAKFPLRFQRGCTCTTATYEPEDDGDLAVINRCREDSPAGDLRMVRGRAWRPAPEAAPGKLKVSFFWPFSSNYWVIKRGAPAEGRYPWAVVSDEEGSTLWILSRTPALDEELYRSLLAELSAEGFDLTKLEETRQEGCWEPGDEGGVAAVAPAP